MSTVTTSDGVRLNVVERGSGETILLIPGWGVSTWWFHRQLEHLADRFRVVAYDPRNQGDSERTVRGARIGRAAADLRDVLAAVGTAPVHVVAWSGGVSTFLHYVELFGTDGIASFVSAGGTPKLSTGDDWELAFYPPDAVVAAVAGIRADFAAYASFVVPTFLALPTPEQVETGVAEMLKGDPEGAARMSQNFLEQDLRELVPLVDVPVLALAGALDQAVHPGNAEWIARHVPDGEWEVFDEASHALFLDEPERFDDRVAAFVDAHRTRRPAA